MHMSVTRSLIAVVLSSSLWSGAASAADIQGKGAVCTADEGAAIKTKLDLEFCSGTSQAKVATFDTPQAGARVLSTTDGGIAHRAGLRDGDVVYQVGGRRVQSGKAAADAVANPDAAGALVINFWREGRTYLVRIWLDGK